MEVKVIKRSSISLEVKPEKVLCNDAAERQKLEWWVLADLCVREKKFNESTTKNSQKYQRKSHKMVKIKILKQE